jgi:PilZ domain-containing protein
MLVRQSFAAQRAESRVDMKLTAMLIGTHGKLGVERAFTENVSSRGVRVISTSEWFTDDTILVSLPAGHFTSAARVAYCEELGHGKFRTGLEFVGVVKPLDVNELDTSLEPPQQ